MADGLTVPFALAAGLSAAVASTKIIAMAGMAEIATSAIAMGLGGYLAARNDQEHYRSEDRRELAEVESLREREIGEGRRHL
jgi:vacuolar iron transporter family protein